MAASIAIDGFGWTFDIGATPLTDGELLSITPPGSSKTTIEVSHAASPDHFYESIAGFKKGDNVSLEANYTQTDYAAFLAVHDSDAAQACTINASDDNYTTTDPTWVFNGHVIAITPSAPMDGKVTLSVEIEVTGKPVFTAGT